MVRSKIGSSAAHASSNRPVKWFMPSSSATPALSAKGLLQGPSIDTMRAEGHAVESICRVLREQGSQVAARLTAAGNERGESSRHGPSPTPRSSTRVRDIAWTTKVDADGVLVRRLSPEGLYGRRKKASGPGTCSTGTSPARAPNRTWVTDFTHVQTWAGFVYVAFIVDVYAQPIVAWHAATTKQTDLVMIPLRMALWQRGREGHPTEPSELIHHSDAGSQYTSVRLTEHLVLEIRPSIGSVGTPTTP